MGWTWKPVAIKNLEFVFLWARMPRKKRGPRSEQAASRRVSRRLDVELDHYKRTCSCAPWLECTCTLASAEGVETRPGAETRPDPSSGAEARPEDPLVKENDTRSKEVLDPLGAFELSAQ